MSGRRTTLPLHKYRAVKMWGNRRILIDFFSTLCVRLNQRAALQWPGNMTKTGTPSHSYVHWATACSATIYLSRSFGNKTKLPMNLTYRQYLSEMPSTSLVPYSLQRNTHSVSEIRIQAIQSPFLVAL